MKPFARLWGRFVRFPFLMMEAHVAAARLQYFRALDLLSEAYSACGLDMPSEHAFIEVNLLTSHVAGRLKKWELFQAATAVTFKQLNQRKPGMRSANIAYLKYYQRGLVEYFFHHMDRRSDAAKYPIDVQFSNLEFHKVAWLLRQTFPVTEPLTSEGEPDQS